MRYANSVFMPSIDRQDQLQHLRSDPGGFGGDRRRARCVRYTHGKDSGSTAGEALLHQDIPGAGVLQVGHRPSNSYENELTNYSKQVLFLRSE